MKAVLLVPALEPNERLCTFLEECMARGISRVVVINDGSSAASDAIFEKAKSLGAHVLVHEKNLGKGAALKTGIRGAMELFDDIDGIITADADGQHAPVDVHRIAQELQKQESGIVLGTREFSKESTPFRSRAGNGISALIFKLMTGMTCHDTQTGLRGISRPQLELALETPGSRYDYEMNFLVEAAQRKLPISQITIETIYFDNNSESHFRPVRDSALIYQRQLKYLAVALGSTLIDLFVFTLLSLLLASKTTAYIWIATVAARCISGFANFKLNQIWSFKVRKRTRIQFYKYLLLFVCVMAASSLFVNLLEFLPIQITIVKAAVDFLLFFVNYRVQRMWVFAEKK